MVGMAIYDGSNLREEIIFLGAMLAITLATIGWVWSGRMGILMTRKTNALSALERLGSLEVNNLKDVVYPYIEAYDEFKRSDCGDRPVMPELEIQKLLGVYEQLSVAVIYGAIDHDMIKHSQMLVYKRIYRGLFHHIERIQEIDSSYFSSFESLTCTWHPDLQRKAAALTNPGGLLAPMRGADV